MNVFQIILLTLSALVIVATIAPLIRLRVWWIRVFDFPRPQIFFLGLILFILNFIFIDITTYLFVLQPLLLISMGMQFYKLYYYSPIKNKLIKNSTTDDRERNISIIISNVLMTNRDSAKLISLVDEYQPDILLTLESDKWWENELRLLEEKYRRNLKIPLDNLYGLHLYSRLELVEPQVKYLIKDDIPSIETRVKLRSGEEIKLYCMHPMPPSPTEYPTSLEKNAELMLVARKINKNNRSTLVIGDFNDVPWSKAALTFRRISRLIDVRTGRGPYNTFNAKIPLLRFPLDQIFASEDFKLNKLKVLPGIGSDHFPVYCSLQYHPPAQKHQDGPEPEAGDQEFINEEIHDGKRQV